MVHFDDYSEEDAFFEASFPVNFLSTFKQCAETYLRVIYNLRWHCFESSSLRLNCVVTQIQIWNVCEVEKK